MKQILQHLKSGETQLVEVPCPAVTPGHVLIATRRSLVSVGTERMLVEFGKAGLITKARQQPEKVMQVLDKIRTDGLFPTLEAVKSKLDQPLPLGYCNAGVVLEVGRGVTQFVPGDRVISNGPHAEVVSVPSTLCARIPDGVSHTSAAYTVIASIALQGIRLIEPTLGERVVVTGLGLIGLLAVQLLRANGCQVLGIDLDPAKLELARSFGATTVDLSAGEDPVVAAEAWTQGSGVDAVLVAASTKSDDPMHQAATMCRKRGRIVLVGVTGLQLRRDDFYKKELSFQVSCSYGPGRYDPEYEANARDYPLPFVRWTEQRNFQAILDLLARGAITTESLLTRTVPLADATKAYGDLSDALGIVIEYPQPPDEPALRRATISLGETPPAPGCRVAVLGAGNYADRVLIPAFRTAGASLHTLVSQGGTSASISAKRHGFAQASTQAEEALRNPEIDAVVIATRHDSHARYVSMALDAGKHVFCEKPLCLEREELETIQAGAASSAPSPILCVGYNRRFAPHVIKMRELLSAIREPKSFLMTVNAGMIPPDHWTQDPALGGGRILGEGCHFVDLLRHLAGAPILEIRGTRMGESVAVRDDKASLTLRFGDGSFGTILYLANGSKAFPKERLEVFAAGSILQLDNFRTLRGYGVAGFKSLKLWGQNKGNTALASAFVEAVKTGGPSPISLDEILEVQSACFDCVEDMHR